MGRRLSATPLGQQNEDSIMEQTELVEKIKNALGLLIVDDGNKVISAGSGIFINGKGRFLTAKHVIENNSNFYKGSFLIRNKNIQTDIRFIPKTPADFAFNLNIPNVWNSINIDLAILEPEQPLKTDYLLLSDKLALEGTDVIIAGYPDDYELVLDFMACANKLNPDINSLTEHYENKFKYYMRQHLFRKAMIGNTQILDLLKPNPFNQDLQMAQYWIDKDLTYGGSGGPVVGLDGKLYGIIIRKGLTDARRFMIQGTGGTVSKLPSGTGIAISPQIIIKWLEELA
jgi:hypothetical protein